MDPFLGEIKLVAFNYAPRGWAFCNGQLLAVTQNTALFSLLGTTYGGDGRTTFALPNLQSRVAIHAGQGPGLSQYTLGQAAGIENVTLLTTQMPMHNHAFPITVDASPGSTFNPAGANFAQVQNQNESNPYDSFTTGQPQSPVQLTASQSSIVGGGQPHSNLQPYLVLNFIIATQGVFPARS